MSGEKLTQVELNQLVTSMLQAKSLKEEELKKADELAKRAAKLHDIVKDIEIEDPAIANRLQQYCRDLQQEDHRLKRISERLDSITVPDSVHNITKDQMKQIQSQLRGLHQDNEKTVQVLDSIQGDVILLTVADETFGKIEFLMQKLQHDIESRQSIIQKWMSGDYQQFLKRQQDFEQQMHRIHQEIDKRHAEDAAKDLEQAEILLEQIITTHEKLVSESLLREDMHCKRRYVLEALRNVCNQLGFDEISAPRYDREADFNSPILQSFDTMNEGRITFRLHLDSHIESDTGIRMEVCENEFDKLSDLLSREYGVQTAFQVVGREEGPKRITKTEKPLPHSRPGYNEYGKN